MFKPSSRFRRQRQLRGISKHREVSTAEVACVRLDITFAKTLLLWAWTSLLGLVYVVFDAPVLIERRV